MNASYEDAFQLSKETLSTFHQTVTTNHISMCDLESFFHG